MSSSCREDTKKKNGDQNTKERDIITVGQACIRKRKKEVTMKLTRCLLQPAW